MRKFIWPASLAVLLFILFQNFTVTTSPIASGDDRTLLQPVAPPTCAVLKTTRHIAVQPTAFTPNGIPATSDENNLDTQAINSAISNCKDKSSKVSVVLEADASSPAGSFFLSGPLTLPPNVSLVIGRNVTLFATRQTMAYENSKTAFHCGQISSAQNGCVPFITLSSGSGLFGPGAIDGQGGQPMIYPSSYDASATCAPSAKVTYLPAGFPSSSMSWWDLANCAGAATKAPGNTITYRQNTPPLTSATNVDDITYFKVFLENSAHAHISINDSNGITIWGIRINTPSDSNLSSYGMGLTHNTDGIDIGSSTNVTITRSWINDGDDHIAIGSEHRVTKGACVAAGDCTATRNITISHNYLLGGHGISIGSLTTAGVSNMLVSDNFIDGGPSSLAALSGLQIKSDRLNGGLVKDIAYLHNCIKNAAHPINVMTSYEHIASGTNVPRYENIYFGEIWITNTVGRGDAIIFDGSQAASPIQITLDNVYTDQVALAENKNSVSSNALIAIVGKGANFVPHSGDQSVRVFEDGHWIYPSSTTPASDLPANQSCLNEFAAMETNAPFPVVWPAAAAE